MIFVAVCGFLLYMLLTSSLFIGAAIIAGLLLLMLVPEVRVFVLCMSALLFLLAIGGL
jgi:hypothetical protein